MVPKTLVVGGNSQDVSSCKGDVIHLEKDTQFFKLHLKNVEKIVVIISYVSHGMMKKVKNQGKLLGIPMEFLRINDFKRRYCV